MPHRSAELSAALARVIPLHRLRDAALIGNVAARWCERQRVWHGPDHLLRMLESIAPMPAGDDRDILLLAALYHDAIYDPREADNEEQSAALLLDHAADPWQTVIVQAAEIILASK
jgi:predicted metal-dependent HD superfamily phosphohydrolase